MTLFQAQVLTCKLYPLPVSAPQQDPQVMEAVASLQAWKAQLTSLQQRLEAELAAAKAAFDDEDDE